MSKWQGRLANGMEPREFATAVGYQHLHSSRDITSVRHKFLHHRTKVHLLPLGSACSSRLGTYNRDTPISDCRATTLSRWTSHLCTNNQDIEYHIPFETRHKMKIEKIYVYPVKALRAVELEEVQVTKHGFHHDRRFMMLHVQKDKDGKTTYKNIAVASYPQSVLFFPSIDTASGIITITYKPPTGDQKSLDFPLSPFTDDLEVVDVTMHGSPTKAYKMQQQYNDWFSSCYGIEVILVYLGPHYRPVLMSSSPNIIRQPSSKNSGNGWLASISSSLLGGGTKDEQLLTFNDCAPYLIASSKSMEDVAARLPPEEASSLDIIKFRPNIIVSGAQEAWDEDFWSQITINSETKIECIHNCGRCKSINIDYSTGAATASGESGQLLKKLQKDRRVDPGVKYSPIFGRYSFLHKDSEGNTIRVGEEVEVTRRNEERSKFGKFSSPL